ncbi:trypsin-1-like [Diabrotica undecimpunctata]|uniref:trypsin-1-like n=1 Tax=Diabrotica undecimpunctata TaxID=50387 RepID=UPI003B6357F0
MEFKGHRKVLSGQPREIIANVIYFMKREAKAKHPIIELTKIQERVLRGTGVSLTEKVVFSSKVQPIRLPKHDIHVPNETPVITAGWGDTVPGSPSVSDDLMEVNINIIDRQICKQRLFKFTERMICAGNLEGGLGSCHADSGGPLELNGTLIGIVSYKSGFDCGTAGFPVAYTKVTDFLTWINKNIDI